MRPAWFPILTCLLAAPAPAETLLPTFAPELFEPGAPIDNPYLPFLPGFSAVLSGAGIDEDRAPFTERSELSYAGPGRTILGLPTTTVLDRAFEGDRLVEETLDYYAQDRAGNVWYLGEDVTNYRYDEDDMLIGTDSASAWIAGENGALPGYAMPAMSDPGFAYYQEFAEADDALDEALVWATGASVEAGGTTYSGVLVNLETSVLDPDLREFKYYAPGIGLIRADEGLDAAFGNPALIVTRGGPAPVPLPPALPLLAAGLAALAALGRRQRLHIG